MELYRVTITRSSNFVTKLKGDTLFGQLCWSIYYLYGKERLDNFLSTYKTDPFLVVSDGFAKGFLPKPHLPSSLLNEDADLKKENRKKIWLTMEQLQNGLFNQAINNKDAKNEDSHQMMVHNAIDYKTSTTGGEGFDPYGLEESKLEPKDIYFLIGNGFALEELKACLELIAEDGYGKKRTIGKGRFEVGKFELCSLSKTKSTSFMSLSAFTPQGLEVEALYYEPFTRFGKHGASLANKNPFKKPLLLADRGAVVVFKDSQSLPYVGSAIEGHSSHKGTVHQGYSIVLPIKELTHE